MKVFITLIIFIYGASLHAQINLKSIECALAFRIMHFTEISSQENGYNFCVDGDNDIFNLLKKQLENQQFKGEKIHISKISNKQYEQCSLIYLGENSKLDNASIGKAIQDNKILVFSSRGDKKNISLILFNQNENKIEFKVNKTLLDANNINISSKVLRLASEVY